MIIVDIQSKLFKLEEVIKEHSPLLVAYSGGVDSSLLAAIAHEILGKELVHCVLVDGPEVPRKEVAKAVENAENLGLSLEVIPGESLSNELKKINPHDRCRHCKAGTFLTLSQAATRNGSRFIADGANVSDLGEHRPGIEAFSSCGVIHPFILANITKTDIREIAKMKGFTFWNKPSAACLYSRIPYGEEITDVKLRMIEEGEEILKGLGLKQVRVRHHDTIARIEVLPEDMIRIIEHRVMIDDSFRKLGFLYSTLDLKGYRSGSMDEVLSENRQS